MLAQMICTAFSCVADILYKTEFGKPGVLQVEIDQLYLTIISILKPFRELTISGILTSCYSCPLKFMFFSPQKKVSFLHSWFYFFFLHVPDKDVAENMDDWFADMTELCSLLEKTEKHVIMAASLHKKLPNTPRLFSTLLKSYITLEKQRKPLSEVSTEF